MKFPIIEIFGGKSITHTRKHEFEKFSGKFVSPNLLHLKGAARSEFRTSAIIDYEGRYYEVIPGKLNRAWLARLAGVWDLTSMDCQLTEGSTVTVGEMQQMAKSWKNKFGRLFRKFLVNQDPNVVFDSRMFRQAWEHSYINLPEEEWGKDAFAPMGSVVSD